MNEDKKNPPTASSGTSNNAMNSTMNSTMSGTPIHFEALRLAKEGLEDLKSKTLFRQQRKSESACDTHQVFSGKSFITFCSNDYLGLAKHPALVRATQEALTLYGVGSGASHLISGHHQAHEDLAERLSSFQASHIPQVKTLTFSTGYMANLGVITALCQLSPTGLSVKSSNAQEDASEALHHGTSIYSAQLNHASIVDGIRLASKSSSVKLNVFNTEALTLLSEQLKKDPSPQKLIICDGVFSMDGNLGPIQELLALAEQHDTLLLVDDAHGFGVLGERGHGILEHLKLNSPRLIYVGTLGKAAGVFGAFVCAHETLCEWIFQKSRPYIYTTACPPAFAVATLKSLTLIESEEGHERRAHLNLLIQTWRETLQFKHWQTPPSTTPIQPIVVGKNDLCLRLDQTLQSLGYLIPAIRPPTVPANTARLRVTLSASHTQEEVNTLAQVLMALESKTEA